ncbi:MAG: peptidoglycan DD-metalloendopeptidase family protein [Coriobacteriia bacterium]|nr:peptidoglycan DD-metalloendopeptidase family protein [Coriobacteriia bacterium]
MNGVAVRSHHLRVLLALILVAVVGFAPGASAAQTEVQKLQEQIKGLQQDAARAGKAYSDAYWQLDKTRVEIARVDAEQAAAQERLGQVSARLSQRAMELYRTGGTDYLGILLSSDDFDEMLLRLEYVQRVGQQDADIIAEVEVLQTGLAASRVELETLKAGQAEEAARLKNEAQQVEAKLKAQQNEYNALKKKLDAAIAAEKARTGTTSARVGPNGMVFPVQGPNTYRDTWGDARSGGRSHKGTDIMSPNGTPCVAVLSGTVRSKDNSLGGKTIWLTADNGWAFYYAHLSSYKVTSGRVSAGQVIGYVGSTGNASASAPHLHFEIHPGGGGAVNPYPYLQKMQ